MKVADLKSGEAKTRTFDYLVVATSHFSFPNFPTFDGSIQNTLSLNIDCKFAMLN